MAKLVFWREGHGPARIVPQCDISVDVVRARIGARPVVHIDGEPPERPTDRPDLTPYRDPDCVLVYITSLECNVVFDKPGYYLLKDVTPAEASQWA